MILSFKDQATEDLYNGNRSTKALRIPHALWDAARRKLDMLNAAYELNDLRIPPANRLEALKGTLKGFYSIRINDQFRIVFQWHEHNASSVQIVDYH